MNDIEQSIIQDVNNYLSIDEIALKYREKGISVYIVKQIMKKNNIKREKTCKMLKIIGSKQQSISLSHIPIEKSINVKVLKKELHQQEIQENKLIYDKRTVSKSKQFKKKINKEPLDIVKEEENEIDISNEIQKMLNSTDKTLETIRSKKNKIN
jgi:hypothetical protein